MYIQENMVVSKVNDVWYLGYRHNHKCYKVDNPEVITIEPTTTVEVVWDFAINRNARIFHIRRQPIIKLPPSLQEGGEGSWLINRMNLEGEGSWYLVGVNEGGFCEISYPAKELLDFLSKIEELK